MPFFASFLEFKTSKTTLKEVLCAVDLNKKGMKAFTRLQTEAFIKRYENFIDFLKLDIYEILLVFFFVIIIKKVFFALSADTMRLCWLT